MKTPIKTPTRPRSAAHKDLLLSGLYRQRVVKLKTRYIRAPKHRGQEMQ